VLRNGMTPPVPVLTVRIDRVTKRRVHRECRLHIGRVLKIEHRSSRTYAEVLESWLSSGLS